MLYNKIDRKERETIQAEREESMHQEVLRRQTELVRAQERLNQLQEGRVIDENVEKKIGLLAKKAHMNFDELDGYDKIDVIFTKLLFFISQIL